MPNDHWTDFALSQQFEAVDKRMEMHEHTLEGLSHFPIDVAKAALNIEHLAGEIRSVRSEVAGVAHQCEQMREDWKQQGEQRQKGRTAIVVAFITGSATVLAALVVLAAQVV